MNEYTIVIQQVIAHTIVVKADNRDDALDLADDVLAFIDEEPDNTPEELVSVVSENTHYETISVTPTEEEEE